MSIDFFTMFVKYDDVLGLRDHEMRSNPLYQ